jgi:hypothetical protein
VSAPPLATEKPVKSKKKLYSFIRAAPLAKKTASLIKKETIEKRISNNEYRISNIEGRNSIDFY